MNIEHRPQVTEFLRQLSTSSAADLHCPICGRPIEIVPGGQSRISALCSSCDFHASVPNPHQ